VIISLPFKWVFAEIDPHYKRALCNSPRNNFLVDIVLAVLVRHPLTETLKMGDGIHDELYGTSGVEHVLGNSPSMQKKKSVTKGNNQRARMVTHQYKNPRFRSSHSLRCSEEVRFLNGSKQQHVV
jgi:hypothetical protein